MLARSFAHLNYRPFCLQKQAAEVENTQIMYVCDLLHHMYNQ